MVFRFLELPRDLRDLILEYAVCVSQMPPSDPWSDPGDRAGGQDVDYEAPDNVPRRALPADPHRSNNIAAVIEGQ